MKSIEKQFGVSPLGDCPNLRQHYSHEWGCTKEGTTASWAHERCTTEDWRVCPHNYNKPEQITEARWKIVYYDIEYETVKYYTPVEIARLIGERGRIDGIVTGTKRERKEV